MAPEPVTVRVHRAQPLGGQTPPNLSIRVEEPFPSFGYEVPIEHSRLLHQTDASALERALFHSLPGGTYDALLGAMLARRASMFVVPFESPTNATMPVAVAMPR